MDPDESHMRKAAHCMVRNLTSGLAMITCREQVVQILIANLKQHFLTALIVCMIKITFKFKSINLIFNIYLDTNTSPERID